MPFKRILLYVWISLLLIVAVFLLLRDGQPSSKWSNEIEIPGKGRLITYKDAAVDILNQSEGVQEIVITGKVYIEAPSQNELTYVLKSEQAVIEVTSGVAVIDASIERTTELIVAAGQASLTPVLTTEGRRSRSVQISEGEKGIISPYAKGIVKQNNRDNNFKAWADFKLDFQNENLENIVLLLQDVYGIKIGLAVPNLSRCRFTGTFDQAQLDDLIKELSANLNLQATENEDGSWILIGDGC